MEIVITAFGILLTAFIAERFYTVHKKQDKFDQEYTKFAEPLLRFLNSVSDERTNLNNLLLTEFKDHLATKNIFIRSLKGKRLRRFNQKWTEYEEEYHGVADLGVFGIASAIAPSAEALATAGPDDPRKWERDRKTKVHSVITELLEIAKVKIWF